MKLRGISLGILLALIAMMGVLVPIQPAAASTKGRKLTTEILGGLAAEQLLTGKTRNGLILGAGAAYAYKRYRDSAKNDHRRRSFAYNRYGGATRTRVYRTYRRRTHTVRRR